MSSADRHGPAPETLPSWPGPLDRPWSLRRRVVLAALACLYLALLAAPVAILVEEHAIHREIDDYLAGEDRGSLFRAEVEYLATLNVLHRALAGDAGADRAAVQQAIDLLYSRYDVLKGGAVANAFGGLPAHRVLIEAMDRAIARADVILAGETGPEVSAAGVQALIREIRTFEEPLRLLLRDALLQSARARDALRDRAKAQRSLRQIATGALIVASLGFIGTLFWNVHQLRSAGTRLGRLAEAVQRSESRLRLIADNLPMLIGYVQADGRVLFVNRTGEEWAVTSAERIIGQGMEALLGPPGYEAIRPSVAEASSGRVGHFEGRLGFPDGSRRIIEASIIPDLTADRRVRGFFVVMIDVTRRKESEEQLRQAQKMEAVGRLTGGVAHDFNNLLGVVIGNLDLVETGLGSQPRELSFLKRARAAAERGAALTHRLLAFSRGQTLSPRPTDVNRLVLDMADTLLPMLGEGVEIETAPCREACVAHVDANQLEASILNLAVNARDAMPGGGRLTIGTDVAVLEADDPERPSDLPAGEYVVISVSDTGGGMSPEVAGRAFEPFFTTKEVGAGSGLGLSMVFGYVKQSGGHVEIDSRKGAGTTVRLYLPRSAAGVACEGNRSEPLSAGGGDGRLILVVEDDRDLLALSTAALNSLGYRTVEAENGQSALAQLERRPDIALLLTDVVLPGGIDGVSLAVAAQRRRPGLRVLFTSGYVARDLRTRLSLPPGAELLAKPFRIAELDQRIARMLRTTD